jgi:hypothetical protein
MRGKFFGQANLVLIGQRYVNQGGSFMLTSGVFAPPGQKCHRRRGRFRGNVVSPTIVGDSVDEYARLFPGLGSVPMATLVAHYVACIEGGDTGRIVRAYG